MIAVEQLFTKPIQDIVKEQQQVQKEITVKNKELRDLFSSKYHELLNCTDLLNGISEYTREIMQYSSSYQSTISNKTQQYMMQINEQHPSNLMNQKISHNKPKSFQYFLKKIKKAATLGHNFFALLASRYLIEKFALSETEKLYLMIFMEQLQLDYNFENIIDCLLTHYVNLQQFFQRLIEYGSVNCKNLEIVLEQLMQIKNFENYKTLIMLTKEFIKLDIEQIYQLLVSQTMPNFLIDEDFISQFIREIRNETGTIEERMLKSLITNVIQQDNFNHSLYQQIQQQTININNVVKEQTKQMWIDWFKKTVESQFFKIKQLVQTQQIKQMEDFLYLYQPYQEQIEQIQQTIQLLNQLPHFEYKYDTCQEILTTHKEKLNQIFDNVKINCRNIIQETNKNYFEICFYYNLLIFYWNEKINTLQIQVFQEENENWNLKDIDQKLVHIYKLQEQGIKRDVISQIIKVMLIKVDIQFSIEYRNLATAIHPEKALEFYQNLFANGKFNNKALKRLSVNLDYSDQQFEPYYSNYSIVSQQKSAVKDQLNAWTQRAQETQPLKQEVQQQSRFGLNLFWKKQ